MNRNSIVTFFLGFAVGVVVAEKYFSRTYERLIEESAQTNNEEPEEMPSEKKQDREEYSIIIENHGYSEEAYEKAERPYIITPNEFGEFEDYTVVSLTYYEGNGVLADDLDEPIEDISGTVGTDAVNHFGEYEEDSVFVRNDRRKTDYEINRDYGDWTG